MDVLNSQKCPISFVNNTKKHGSSRASSSAPSGSSSAAFSSATRFYCSNHGGSQARHNEKDCRLNKSSSSNAWLKRPMFLRKLAAILFASGVVKHGSMAIHVLNIKQ